jgi:hypothetical protein
MMSFTDILFGSFAAAVPPIFPDAPENALADALVGAFTPPADIGLFEKAVGFDPAAPCLLNIRSSFI